ncbi:MAG: non-canonical purine NTP pyrophosphatase [Candidatus Diapherotrites archaeon]
MLYFVSTNKHKFLEIKRVLAEYGIKLSWKNISLSEPDSTKIEDIAKKKAEQAYKIINKPLIVEDTGVFFEGFHNFPGSKARRVFERLGYEGLLNIVAKKSDRAYFKTVICFTDGKIKKLFVGKLRGKISQKVYCKNKNVMPYERIFIPCGSKKPLCMLLRNEKNKFSHRAKAARKLALWLKANFF